MKQKTESYFLVIGLGASGVSMARFLHSKGHTVVATDIDGSRACLENEFTSLGIRTEIGFHNQETFDGAKMMVVSPGIPLTHPYIKTAAAKGVGITGELDIFTRFNKLPIIAISGTNGKTSTTTLIGDMLRGCGMKPFVGGNIGTPLVEQLMSKEKVDIIVAEISSFQLDLSQTFRPDVGVLLNISEDHLDRYENFKGYRDSKWSLFKNQTTRDVAVINRQIPDFDTDVKKLNAAVLTFSSEEQGHEKTGENKRTQDALIDTGRIHITTQDTHYTIETRGLQALQGQHNHENIAAAALACLATGADIKGILKGLGEFKNLPHRLAFAGRIGGISFFNDSKATNTDAVIRAVDCFDNPIILILGGRKKGTVFSQLIPAVQRGVKHIIAIGESKADVIETFSRICPVQPANDMKEAVQKSFDLSGEGDVVLLSPACASFDMYDNYSHRGNDFETHVSGLGK